MARAVPRKVALEMLFTGNPISAEGKQHVRVSWLTPLSVKILFLLPMCEVKPWSLDRLIAAGAYRGFCSMRRLEVFLLPLDGMLVQ